MWRVPLTETLVFPIRAGGFNFSRQETARRGRIMQLPVRPGWKIIGIASPSQGLHFVRARRHPGRSSIFRDRVVSHTQGTRRRGNLYGINLVKFAFVCSSRVFYTSCDRRARTHNISSCIYAAVPGRLRIGFVSIMLSMYPPLPQERWQTEPHHSQFKA